MTREEKNKELETLMGMEVVLICVNFIYTGVVSAIHNDCVSITNAKIVLETGETTKDKMQVEAVLYSSKWTIMLDAIESFGGYRIDEKLMKKAIKKDA